MARLRKPPARERPYDDLGLERYGHLLTKKATYPWSRLPFKPERVGPTWQTHRGKWKLPDLTLGWHALGWSARWLQQARGVPWVFTDEQARFILWWYAIDDRGVFEDNDGVLQRLKGWGKDPVGACLCAIEAFGPCRFAGWNEDRPLAEDVPEAWVQTAAVSLEQTKNTMRLLPGLFTPDARRYYGIQIGKTVVHGLGDTRLIEAITSSPATLEGARATFVLLNETHLWDASNEGHDMADVIERNQAKAPGGEARTLRITNAYDPAKDSTAQRDREAWEKAKAGTVAKLRLLYDSLEAPANAPLTAKAAPQVVRAIRGDSVWLDVPRIVGSILDVRNSPSRSRRFWYNQITATEDAWVSVQEWDGAANPAIVPSAGATVTLGFDGSKTDDHTALVGCLVEEDHLFEIEVWVPNERTGEIDRTAVDRKVREIMELYDVVGFYSDLEHWESYVDDWAQEFGEDLVVRSSQHQPIAWDIRGRVKLFTQACVRLHGAILESTTKATKNPRNPGPRLTHDGAARFRLHALNARRAPNKWGISVRKEHRESSKKIDAVPAAVLARLARLDYLAIPPAKRKRRKHTGIVYV